MYWLWNGKPASGTAGSSCPNAPMNLLGLSSVLILRQALSNAIAKATSSRPTPLLACLLKHKDHHSVLVGSAKITKFIFISLLRSCAS